MRTLWISISRVRWVRSKEVVSFQLSVKEVLTLAGFSGLEGVAEGAPAHARYVRGYERIPQLGALWVDQPDAPRLRFDRRQYR